MPDFLLEIGSEEIPAGFISGACEYLKGDFEKRLTDAGIGFENIESDGTPRRFYLSITGLEEKQKDKEETIIGILLLLRSTQTETLQKREPDLQNPRVCPKRHLQKLKPKRVSTSPV